MIRRTPGFIASFACLLASLVFAQSFGPLHPSSAQKKHRDQNTQDEEQIDYYKKWLTEDARFIIMPEEKDVFFSLTTDEERQAFIEQFWHRRDPDFRTAHNEFKEEHYRRIAYANEKYTWAKPGWLTDRGRTYIMHGPPAQLEDHAGAGIYNRPQHEGGGYTSTYPFEIWRYRYIQGMGSDIELEFVDKCMCGEFRLAKSPYEKDAFLEANPELGPTGAELMGDSAPVDRPYFDSTQRTPGKGNYPLLQERYQDHPFVRYERYAAIQRAPQIKYRDLQEIVEVDISFEQLPMRVRDDYFRLNEEKVLVPITVEIDNRNLDFSEKDGLYKANLAFYGLVTSLSRRIINEFEDDLEIVYNSSEFQEGRLKKATYQKILLLESKGRYRLDLVLKDKTSGKAAVIRKALVPPKFNGDTLVGSSLLLSQKMEPLDEVPEGDMFTLGDVKVLPSLDGIFSKQIPLGVYLQLYNFGIEQTEQKPSLAIHYKIKRDGQVFLDMEDPEGGSIHFFSDVRVILLQHLSVNSLPEGSYTIEVEVRDEISGQPPIHFSQPLELKHSL